MLKQKTTFILLAAVLLVGSVPLSAETVVSADKQDELLKVLKSADASRKEKVDACRLLTFIATKKAVPTLAGLLSDENLNHMARYALEPIDDSSVDDALLEALGKLKGKPLVGVIGSIGVRGDSRAVKPMAKMLRASDTLVAFAAARSLGNIGTFEAAKFLKNALAKSSGDLQLAICEGLFRCAENLDSKQAIAIYDQLRALKSPHQARAGGLRGAIIARGKDGMKLLAQNLESNDYILFSAAVQATHDMPGRAVTRALAANLSKLPADNRILIIQTLAKRGDKAAMPAIVAAAKRGPKAVRIAAIEAMPPIGDAAGIDILFGLLNDTDGDISRTAKTNLIAMPGKKVDKAVMAMLAGSDTDNQMKALELIESRRMANVAPALLKTARDDNESVRIASIKILGNLPSAVKFPVLVGLLLNAESPLEIRTAERALSATCTRESQLASGRVTIRKAVYGAAGGPSADVTKKVAAIVAEGASSVKASNSNFGDTAPGIVKQLKVEYTVDGVTQSKTIKENETMTLAISAAPKAFVNELSSATTRASTQQKLALLRVLRSTHSPLALDTVRTAAKDSNAEISNGAVSLLCDWPTLDALPDVLELTRTATDPKVKILAIRGAIRLVPLQNISQQEKLTSLKEIATLVKRNEEKKLLLGSLSTMSSVQALKMAMSHIDDTATKSEACFAAVAIAEKIKTGKSPEVIRAMRKVLQTTDNNDIRKRARKMLNKVK
jgi:HEAT repeat protein